MLFEKGWKQLLEDEGLTSFHMTDFMRNDWCPEQRQNLLNKLTALLYIRTRKHSSETVIMDACRQVTKSTHWRKFLVLHTPLSEIICARNFDVGKWNMEERTPSSQWFLTTDPSIKVISSTP